MSRGYSGQDIQPLSEFCDDVDSAIKQVNETGRPLLITQNGKGVAAVVGVAEYQAIQKKIELLEESLMA